MGVDIYVAGHIHDMDPRTAPFATLEFEEDWTREMHLLAESNGLDDSILQLLPRHADSLIPADRVRKLAALCHALITLTGDREAIRKLFSL